MSRLLYLLLALALVRGVMYAILIPPWQAPDEPGQFERAKAALSAQEWVSTSANGPAWYDDLSQSLFTFPMWDFLDAERPTYKAGQPLSRYIILYNEAYEGQYGSRPTYAAIGWPIMLAPESPIVWQLYLVRLNTVLMSVIVIYLTYRLVETIFPHNRFLILGVPLLVLFNPQHTHLMSTVNNGNLAELLATATLYFVVRGLMRGFSWPVVLAMLACALVAMWAKATAYFLPFAIATIGLFYLWRHRRRWYWLLPIFAVLAGLGYLFAPERLRILSTWAWQGIIGGRFQLDPVVPIDLFRSFWAFPGWVSVALHPVWYWLWLFVCLLAVVGWGVFLVRQRHLIFSDQTRPQLQALTALAVATVVAVSVPLVWSAITNTIVYRQGRSIYPVIVPISLFLVLGWYQFVPAGWRKQALVTLAAALVLFDALVLFAYAVPFFYSRY
ncbi:MAG: hypothetical protein KDI79_25820 [Anaerolineae bacterium]|nr:hypothetical protein [Anaerolineae bacterium]